MVGYIIKIVYRSYDDSDWWSESEEYLNQVFLRKEPALKKCKEFNDEDGDSGPGYSTQYKIDTIDIVE